MMILLGFIGCFGAAGSQTSMHIDDAIVMLQIHAKSFHGEGHLETFWAEQAYRFNLRQGDYDLVMSVPKEEREEMYTRIQAGPCLPPQNKTNVTYDKEWLSEESFRERYARYGMDHVQALVDRGAIERRYNPDCPRRSQYFVQKEEDVFAALPCQPPQNATSIDLEKTWMSEESFRKRYERYGTDHVQKLLQRGVIESRRNPDCPRRKQYFVKSEGEVLAAFPCLPPQNATDLYEKENCHAACYTGIQSEESIQSEEHCHAACDKEWMSEENFHQKYEVQYVHVLLARGIVEQRQNPDCPRRVQYLVKDEQEVLAYTPKTHWFVAKFLRDTDSDDVITNKVQDGSIQTRDLSSWRM